MKHIKLKDYRYQINGINSNRPLNQCLEAVIIGLSLPLILSLIFRIINYLITGS